MFGIGTGELLVVVILALIFIGPEKLPGIAKTLGKFARRVQRSVDEIKEDIQK